MTMHSYQHLITLFNQLFEQSEQTILIAGGKEPLYLPKDNSNSLNRIIFTHDYYASALHEIAHWCIASLERRKLTDYGYWYNPDRGSLEDQAAFEQAEAKPQAIEWIFSIAAGVRFQISADNLAYNNEASLTFKQNIHVYAMQYLTVGLPARAEKFKEGLLDLYQRRHLFNVDLFAEI